MVATEAVVLAGGADPRLSPLTDPEHPKCLLPVANSPAILYALSALRNAGITSVFVVVCGDSASAKVQKYVAKEPQLSSVHAKVVTVDAETGSADAVRAVADKLTGDTVVVISGDTVTDTPLSAVLFTHSIRNAGITTALARASASASANTKLGKTPKGVDYVAIDEKRQRLLTYAYSPTQLHKVAVPLAAVKACSGMVLTTEMRDACIYILSRPVIDKIVQAPDMSSIKVDVLPQVVNEQWSLDRADSLRADSLRTSSSLPEPAQVSICEETARYFAEQSPLQTAAATQAGSLSKFDGQSGGVTGSGGGGGGGAAFCAVHVIEDGAFCRRINTMQTYLDANRDLAATAGSGGLLAAQTAVHASADVGNKATVAAGSLVGESSSIQDRVSIKRTVVGRRCQVGVNARILNSVLLDGCAVGEGAHVQNTIVGEDVSVGAKAQLRECQVAHTFVVPEGADHRDEALAAR